jgi:hypothetical protein
MNQNPSMNHGIRGLQRGTNLAPFRHKLTTKQPVRNEDIASSIDARVHSTVSWGIYCR